MAKLSRAGSGQSAPRRLPYLLSYVVMACILQISSAILFESTLSMLGLGASGDQPGHHALLGHSVGVGADRAWWAVIPPTVMLTLIVFSLLLLQSSLNEVFNPRLRRGRAARKRAVKEGYRTRDGDRGR